ncbi:shikimate kinase 1 [Euphorbia peplus]|nr:shikimate kinase 1 [Euphorbia peplus]
MDAKLAQGLHFSAKWVLDSDHFMPTHSSSALKLSSSRFRQKGRIQMVVSPHFQPLRNTNRLRSISLEVSCYNNSSASVSKSGQLLTSFDESLILKNKSQKVEPYLNGRCIYLVGMMGSGKTTVGNVLSQVLGYSFCDCDKLIEEAVDGASVADIFKLYGEGFFRMKETEVLKKLSVMHGIVVSTGGGAVVRPINWEYMQKGISVWLDVPLEALAQRIAAVGTDSRPLLHQESGDAYSKAFSRLSALLEEREGCYENADARVSLEKIAAKLGYRDVSSITPTAIAIEAMEQIERFLEEEGNLPVS